MRKVIIGNKEVEYFESIQELPVGRFKVYKRMCLIDAAIGSDLSDFDNHIRRAVAYAGGDNSKLTGEFENLRLCVQFILTKVDPKLLSFAALVAKIDGINYEDLTDAGLEKVIQELNGAPYSAPLNLLEEVKKKIGNELTAYFPDKFRDDMVVLEYYSLLKQRTLSIISGIVDDIDTGGDVERLGNLILTLSPPSKFSGEDNEEVKLDKDFETMRLFISREFKVDVKNMTVLEFYNAFFQLEKLNRPKKANNGR